MLSGLGITNILYIFGIHKGSGFQKCTGIHSNMHAVHVVAKKRSEIVLEDKLNRDSRW